LDAEHGVSVVAQQLNLGAEAASRVTQRMVLRLFQLRRRSFVQSRAATVASSRVAGAVSGTDDGAIDAPQVMVERPLVVPLV
jgi:hypothetical protein